MKRRVVLPALLLTACAHLQPEQSQPFKVTEGMIERVQRPPVHSGISRAWALVEIRASGGNVIEAHVLYLSEATRLPPPGTECAIIWHTSRIDGFTINGSVDPERHHRIADSLDCIGDAFDYVAS